MYADFPAFWTPLHLVYILVKSTVLNSRNLANYILFRVTSPLPLGVYARMYLLDAPKDKLYIQSWENFFVRGCKKVAGKLRQRWYATAANHIQRYFLSSVDGLLANRWGLLTAPTSSATSFSSFAGGLLHVIKARVRFVPTFLRRLIR